jgi:hypothetical protein
MPRSTTDLGVNVIFPASALASSKIADFDADRFANVPRNDDLCF